MSPTVPVYVVLVTEPKGTHIAAAPPARPLICTTGPQKSISVDFLLSHRYLEFFCQVGVGHSLVLTEHSSQVTDLNTSLGPQVPSESVSHLFYYLHVFLKASVPLMNVLETSLPAFHCTGAHPGRPLQVHQVSTYWRHPAPAPLVHSATVHDALALGVLYLCVRQVFIMSVSSGPLICAHSATRYIRALVLPEPAGSGLSLRPGPFCWTL